MKPKANTRTALGTAVLLALIPVLASCSSTDENTTPDAAPATVTETVSGTAAETNASSAGESAENSLEVPPADPSTQSPTDTQAPAPTPGTCPTSGLAIGVSNQQGAAGSMLMDLTFTNNGSSDCELHGFPGVSLVGTGDGSQLGAPATREDVPAETVELQPGDTATAALRITRAENFEAGSCGLVPADGLRIYPPGDTEAAFVELDSISGCVSENIELLSIKPVRP